MMDVTQMRHDALDTIYDKCGKYDNGGMTHVAHMTQMAHDARDTYDANAS